jgi:vesicle coat complex subunit
MKSDKSKKEKKKMVSVYEGTEDDDVYDNKKACMKLAKESLSFDEVLVLTHHKDEAIRLKALQRFCPCRVQDEVEQFWTRIFQMVNDESPKVRYQVLHNMCDGSPDSYESKVAEALEIFNRDPDTEVRRRAHKVLASYLRTGKWNVL